jgi:hypothetical protein
VKYPRASLGSLLRLQMPTACDDQYGLGESYMSGTNDGQPGPRLKQFSQSKRLILDNASAGAYKSPPVLIMEHNELFTLTIRTNWI